MPGYTESIGAMKDRIGSILPRMSAEEKITAEVILKTGTPEQIAVSLMILDAKYGNKE